MPFRAHVPSHWQWLVLPVYASVSLIAVAVWTIGAFISLGGWGKSSAGARLFIFGFDGIAVFVVIGVVVAVYLLQTAAYANNSALIELLRSADHHPVAPQQSSAAGGQEAP